MGRAVKEVVLFLILFLGANSAIANFPIDRGEKYVNPAVGAFVSYSAVPARPEHGLPGNYQANLVCSATLLCPNMIATAEHCIQREDGTYLSYDKFLKFGFTNRPILKRRGSLPLPRNFTQVVQSFVPPVSKLSAGETKKDNVVLLKLEESSKEGFAEIQFPKVPSPEQAEELVGQKTKVRIAGFGNHFNRKDSPSFLQNGRLLAFEVSLVEAFESVQKRFFKSYDQKKQGRNVCTGDSGGPLFVESKGQDWFFGVTSSFRYLNLYPVERALRIAYKNFMQEDAKEEFERYSDECGKNDVSHPNYSAGTPVRQLWIDETLAEHCPAG